MSQSEGSGLQTRTIALAAVGSTSAEALRLALEGEPLPFWLVAASQSSGRGRAGRAWVSPPGNLYASLALRLECAPAAAGQLSFVTGIAIHDAIAAVLPAIEGLRLKWPNDVLAGRSKLAGVLVETSQLPKGAGLLAVIGIGINVAEAPDVGDRPTTCLAALGARIQSTDLLCALDRQLETWLAVWDNGRAFGAVREAWSTRGGRTGEPISINVDGRVRSGRFGGLDHDGALLMIGQNGASQRVTFGDVALTGSDSAD